MIIHQSHALVLQPLLQIRGTNLKMKNPCFIANISPGIFRAVRKDACNQNQIYFFHRDNILSLWIIQDENNEVQQNYGPSFQLYNFRCFLAISYVHVKKLDILV